MCVACGRCWYVRHFSRAFKVLASKDCPPPTSAGWRLGYHAVLLTASAIRWGKYRWSIWRHDKLQRSRHARLAECDALQLCAVTLQIIWGQVPQKLYLLSNGAPHMLCSERATFSGEARLEKLLSWQTRCSALCRCVCSTAALRGARARQVRRPRCKARMQISTERQTSMHDLQHTYMAEAASTRDLEQPAF